MPFVRTKLYIACGAFFGVAELLVKLAATMLSHAGVKYHQ
jgi:hypothetical protein